MLGVVTLANRSISTPTAGVIVSIAGESAVTDAQGAFEITAIAPGRHLVDVRMPSTTAGGSDGSVETNSASSPRVWSGIVDVASTGETILPISITPLAELLRIGRTRGGSAWQIAFYASPPAGKAIVEGSFVMTPNRIKRDMSPHFLPQWHCWWNVSGPEEGTYVETVKLNDGSTEIAEIYMAREMFTDIILPEQVAPENDAMLDTTTPYLEYWVPVDSEAVHVRIREIGATEDVWIRDCPSTGITVPEGMLEAGKQYMWRVHIVNKPAVLPWMEALTAPRYFMIESD